MRRKLVLMLCIAFSFCTLVGNDFYLEAKSWRLEIDAWDDVCELSVCGLFKGKLYSFTLFYYADRLTNVSIKRREDRPHLVIEYSDGEIVAYDILLCCQSGTFLFMDEDEED